MSQYVNDFIEFLFRERWGSPSTAVTGKLSAINAKTKPSAGLLPREESEKVHKEILRSRARMLGVKIEELRKGILEEDKAIGQRKKPARKARHFFLPSKDNNYHPHILHPKRVALYSIALVLIKLVMAGAVISYPVDAIFADDSVTRQKDALIQQVNEQRMARGAKALAENRLLDHVASLRAQDLSIKSGMDSASAKHVGVSEYLNSFGYRYSAVEEKVADNFFLPTEIIKCWTNDNPGNAGIYSQDADEIGIGLASDGRSGGGNMVYVAVVADKDESIDDSQPSAQGTPLTEPALTASSSPATSSSSAASLIEPEIANLEGISVLKDGNIKLEIFSPNTDIITLYVDNSEKTIKNIYTGTLADNESNYAYDLSLAEGQHSVLAKAAKGKYERYSKNYVFYVDFTPPAVDLDKTAINLSQTDKQGELTLDISSSLSSDTSNALVLFGNYKIPLAQSAENANQFTGSFTISNEDKRLLDSNLKSHMFLIAEDMAGNTTSVNLNALEKAGLTGTYKNNSQTISYSQGLMKKMLDSEMLLYKILLIFTSFILLLNILLEVHVQRPRAILTASGLILLLSTLILIR